MLTIHWSLAKASEELSRNHCTSLLTVPRQMALLKEQYAEEEELLQCCYCGRNVDTCDTDANRDLT